MRKLMYLLPVAALAMASCSNSDDPIAEVNVPKLATADQLMIRPAMAGASTRATEYSTAADIQSFKLIATGNFMDDDGTGNKPGTTTYDMSSGIEITGDATGSVWSFPIGHEYVWWGDATTKATFTAYAPADATVGSEVEIPAEMASQKDYIVAYNEGLKNDFKTGVPLNFQHATSQIVVKAVNKTTSAVTIKVKGTRMVNVVSKGTLSLPTVATNGSFSWDNTDYTPWALGNATDTYADTYDNAVLLEESNPQVIGQSQYLLPQQLTAATYTSDGEENWETNVTGNAIAFLIQVKTVADTPAAIYPAQQNNESTKYAWAYVPVDTDWQPGRKYTYTINFAKDAYGKVDPNQVGGTDNPTDDDNPSTVDPKPGEDVVDNPLQLTFTVSVEDWIPMAEPKNL